MLLLKTLLTFFNKPDFRFSIFLLLMMLATAFIELAGIGSLFPYIKILETPSYIHTNSVLNALYRFFGFSDNNHFLVLAGFGIFFLILLKAVMTTLNNYFQAKLTYRINNRLSKHCLSSFMRLPYARVIDQNSSILSKHLLVDVAGVATVLQAILIIMTDVIVAFTLIALMIWLNPVLILSVIAFLGILLFLMNHFMKQRIHHVSVANEYCNRYSYKTASEALSSIKDAKIYQVENYFVQRYLKWKYQTSDQLIQLSVLTNLPTNILNVMGFGILLIVLLYLIITRGNLIVVLPTIGLIAVSVQRLLPSASRISTNIANVRRYKPLVYIVRDAIDTLLKDDHKKNLNTKESSEIRFNEALILNNVTYRYPGTENNALTDIFLTIRKNTSFGIVGESGAGKSTLVDILLGLLTIDKGSILCDGVEIHCDNDISLSHLVGYVPQQVFLLDASIKENIAFGVDADTIDLLALQKVIRIAQLEEFIDQLPNGIDTKIGEKGAKISGGQRQRIGIARALYRDPDILIMDEATSALDAATEKEFNNALKNLMQEKTLIVIAHRLSSVQICEEIIQLEQGRIIASGKYNDMLEKSESFRRIYDINTSVLDD